MARYDDATDIEKAVIDAWDAIVFPGGGYDSAGTFGPNVQERMAVLEPEWDRVLAMAFDGEKWLVRPELAVMVTTSRLYNAVGRRLYGRAREDAERCMKHPGDFDMIERIRLPIWLNVAILLDSGNVAAVRALHDLIDSGLGKPGDVSLWIARSLEAWLDVDSPPVPVSDEMRSLIRAMAVARRRKRRLSASISKAESWRSISKLAGEMSEDA